MSRDHMVGAVVALVVVFALVLLDRSILHWYVPATRSDAEVADGVAAILLGDWDRSIPQSKRSDNNHQSLRDSVRQPGPGSSAQFQRAVVRTANAAALPLIWDDEMRGASQAQALEALQQCVEYLLAINGATSACNMVPIAP